MIKRNSLKSNVLTSISIIYIGIKVNMIKYQKINFNSKLLILCLETKINHSDNILFIPF